MENNTEPLYNNRRLAFLWNFREKITAITMYILPISIVGFMDK